MKAGHTVPFPAVKSLSFMSVHPFTSLPQPKGEERQGTEDDGREKEPALALLSMSCPFLTIIYMSLTLDLEVRLGQVPAAAIIMTR